MRPNCPAPADLLQAALSGDSAQVDDPLTQHVSDCASCLHELEHLRETVRALRSPALSEWAASGPCLDELDIAALVDGADPEMTGAAIAHLASCGRCRAQLVAVTRVMQDRSVAAEMQRLEPPASQRHGSRAARLVLAGGLAAAALAGVMLWPQISRRTLEGGGDTVILREPAITTTAAPRILGPLEKATVLDSLRWTSVPRADLYRITVWDRDGTVVWEGETRDTFYALPGPVGRTRDIPLLWTVKARTGWNRWVASDLGEFTVRESRGIP